MEVAAALPASVVAEAAAPAVEATAKVASSVAASAAEAAAGATSGIANAAAGATSELSSAEASLAGEAGTAAGGVAGLAQAPVEGAGSIANGVGAGISEPVEPVRDLAGLENRVAGVSDEIAAREGNAAGGVSAETSSVEAATQPHTAAEPAAAEGAAKNAQHAEAQTAEARAQRTQELTDKVRTGDATDEERAELNELNTQKAREEEHRTLKDKMLSGKPLSSEELAKLNSYEKNGTPGEETPTPKVEKTAVPEGTEQADVAALSAEVVKLNQQLEALGKIVEVMLKQQLAEEQDPEKKTRLQMLLDTLATIVLSVVAETTGTVNQVATAGSNK